MSKYIVCGHQNPDTDSIVSAISYSYLLNQTGHQAKAVALGTPSEETAFALKSFGFEAPQLIEKAADVMEEGCQLVLVDHNEAQQSLPDRADFKIAQVIDHHRIANFETAEPLFYRAETVGCSNTIIYKMYKEQGVDIPQNVAGLMLSAIVSDTLLMKSPTCTPEDVEAIYALAEIAGVDYNEYGINLLKAGADLTKKTVDELLTMDAKSFPMGSATVRIAQVNTVDEQDVLSRQSEVEARMAEIAGQEGYQLFLLVITNILTNDSTGVVIGDGKAQVEAAFQAPVENNLVELKGVVSRKKQVVPPLTKAFEA